MANHYRVSPKFWLKARRRGWTDQQVTLALYLLTCDHRNLEGLYRLPKPYIAADLAWPAEKVEETLASVCGDGFASYDEDAEVVLIPKALKHQAPSTENQIKGAIAQLARIPRTSLWDAFRMACASHCPRLADAIDMEWPSEPEGDPNGSSRTRAGSRAPASSSSSNSNSETAASPPRARAHEPASDSRVESIECPKCGAEPGTKCKAARGGTRDSAHLQRHHAVGELLHLKSDRRADRGRIPRSPREAAAEQDRRRRVGDLCSYFPGVPAFTVTNAARAVATAGQPATVDAIRAHLAAMDTAS